MCKQRFLFYTLLGLDGEQEALERATAELADLPELLSRATFCSSFSSSDGSQPGGNVQKQPSTSDSPVAGSLPYNLLEDALLGLGKKNGLLVAGTWNEVSSYLDEAAILHSQGRRAASLKFLGRALEACAILYSMGEVLRMYDVPLHAPGGHFGSALRALVAREPGLTLKARELMLEYGMQYHRHLEHTQAWVAGLAAVRRCSPAVYRVLSDAMAKRCLLAAGSGDAGERCLVARTTSVKLRTDDDGTAAAVRRYKQLWLKRSAYDCAELAVAKSL